MEDHGDSRGDQTGSEPSVYRVKNWDEHFENNRTRTMDIMRWVPVPNKFDGDGYTSLVDGDCGAALYGAWVGALGVASKCHPRGTLLRDNKQPHDARSISRITRLSEEVIQKMLDLTSSSAIGWMEVVPLSLVAHARQEGDTNLSGECAKSTTEGKGKEGKQQREGARPPSVSPDVVASARIVAARAGVDENAIVWGLQEYGADKVVKACGRMDQYGKRKPVNNASAFFRELLQKGFAETKQPTRKEPVSTRQAEIAADEAAMQKIRCDHAAKSGAAGGVM